MLKQRSFSSSHNCWLRSTGADPEQAPREECVGVAVDEAFVLAARNAVEGDRDCVEWPLLELWFVLT